MNSVAIYKVNRMDGTAHRDEQIGVLLELLPNWSEPSIATHSP